MLPTDSTANILVATRVVIPRPQRAGDAELNVKCVLMKFVVSHAYFRQKINEHGHSRDLFRVVRWPWQLANFPCFLKSFYRKRLRGPLVLVYETKLFETLFNYRGKRNFWSVYITIVRIDLKTKKWKNSRFVSINRDLRSLFILTYCIRECWEKRIAKKWKNYYVLYNF